MKKLKILEMAPFSKGICGVWQRVRQEASGLAKKGHSVTVFSSNITKGTNKIASANDKFGKVKIRRFPSRKLGGESFMTWNFKEEATKLNPDVIIVHNYRHIHTTKALKVAKKIKSKIYLVTHAPFIEKGTTRTKIEEQIVNLYDKTIGRLTINKFNKILTISNWEVPYLLKIGAKKNKIIHVSNSVPDEFFKLKKHTKKNKKFKILFLGRIHPVKNLETLFKAVKNLNVELDIVGMAEKKYEKELKNIIFKEDITNINLKGPIYDLKKKIKEYDSCDLFVLPSKREASPQVIIEAMARGKIIIASRTQGGKEAIKDKKNGYLFNIDDSKKLKELIIKVKKLSKKEKAKISKEAIKTSKRFKLSNIINKLEGIINED